MNASADAYRVFRLARREVLVVRTDAREVAMKACWAVPGATWRAQVARGFLWCAVASGTERWLASSRTSPLERIPDAEWAALWARLQRVLNRADLVPAVVRAGDARRKRFYLYAYSPDAKLLAVVKIVADPAAAPELDREAAALDMVQAQRPRTFRVPKVLATATVGNLAFLALAAVPPRARVVPARWSRAVRNIRDELAGPVREIAAIEHYSWWQRFSQRAAGLERLSRALDEVPPEALRACRAHGDFANWNLFREDNEHWLLDWEEYCEDAPPASDEIRFFLGAHTRVVARRPVPVLRALLRHFGGREHDVAVALAFLHAKGVEAATHVARKWGAQ